MPSLNVAAESGAPPTLADAEAAPSGVPAAGAAADWTQHVSGDVLGNDGTNVIIQSRTLWVSECADVPPTDLEAAFAAFGPLESFKNLGHMAFVVYRTRDDAAKAQIAMNTYQMGAAPLKVLWSAQHGPKEFFDWREGVSRIPLDQARAMEPPR